MLSTTEVKHIRSSFDTQDAVVVRMFDALGDIGRLRIFRMLATHKNLCVSDVAKVLNMSVPAVSQHLKIMEMSGLVMPERMGQKTCYRIQTSKTLTKLLLTNRRLVPAL